MLADFCLRLAAGMMACLLLLSPARTARPAPGQKPLAHPNFFRTHFLTVLALATGALLLLRDSAGWELLTLLGATTVLAFLGSAVWSLERSPGGVTLIVLTTAVLAAALVVESDTALAGSLSSALLLGAALSAMLMGHSYLIAPAMSLEPLYRLLAAVGATLLARGTLACLGLYWWTARSAAGNLEREMLLWLGVRWIIGVAGPLALGWL